MKYKVGDKVKVREDLQRNTYYKMCDSNKEDCATSQMLEFAGKIVTIANILSTYTIKEDKQLWCWTDEMFEDNSKEVNCKKEIEMKKESHLTDYKVYNNKTIILEYSGEKS